MLYSFLQNWKEYDRGHNFLLIMNQIKSRSVDNKKRKLLIRYSVQFVNIANNI